MSDSPRDLLLEQAQTAVDDAIGALLTLRGVLPLLAGIPEGDPPTTPATDHDPATGRTEAPRPDQAFTFDGKCIHVNARQIETMGMTVSICEDCGENF